MATKVHPLQEGSVAGSGPGRGNCCPCACCGGDPGPVDTSKILADGGKFVKLEDGRVVEYYVYGSDKPDATVLVQTAATFSTSWFFGHNEVANKKLAELNVKGISISYPGVGYSSLNYGSNLLYWCQHDVGAVLEAEKVGSFMVEGTSLGTASAMGIAYAHHAKVTKMHLHCPFIPQELIKEVTPHAPKTPSGEEQPECVNQRNLQSCCCGCLLFCCVSCQCCCLRCCCGPKAFAVKNNEEQYPGLAKLQYDDVRRSVIHSGAGMCMAQSQEYCQRNWGFDPRELAKLIKGKDRVLVSMAVDDKSVHPDWCRYLATLFEAAYQVGDGQVLTPKLENGHDFWGWRWAKGLITEQLLLLDAPSQQTMDGNAYWHIPKPEGFSLAIPVVVK